jgi:hypothetical protein
MARIGCLLLTTSVPLMLFGWWGVYTAAGRRAFDEMAGMVPFGAGALGALLAVIGGGLYAYARLRA